MPILSESTALVIYNDPAANNNPQYRFADWKRSNLNVPVINPLESQYRIQPGTSQILFSGSHSTSIDATTVFAITLNNALPSTYRITSTSGTAPAFRVARSYSAAAQPLTLTVNNNSTLDITGGVSFTAGGIVAGDNVFIPGVITGDSASPFSVLNGGAWVVLAVSAGKLTLGRPPTVSFSGVSEAVTPASAPQFLVFAPTGVLIGDNLEISLGFSSVTQNTYQVTNVTPTWVEFSSTLNLPLESAIQPTAPGMVFYLANKRYVRIEVDQEAAVRFNTDVSGASQANRLSPRIVADQANVGYMIKWGTTWALEVQNRSRSSVMIVTVHSAE